jgi:tetratricopeptide (TPR) repeat protein
MRERSSIPWSTIVEKALKKKDSGSDYFAAFTDVVIDIASEECMKEEPNTDIIALGVQACLTRGRIAEALFLSTGSDSVEVLSLRAVVLFVLSEVESLREAFDKMNSMVDENSAPSDQVRLSTAKVFLAAAERDSSVIMCVMEFDSLLESHPEQVEEPLTETMFALYVVGDLLRMVGQIARASRINDTLEDMALKGNHRMFLALSENLRGNIANYQGDLDGAEKHYLKFKEISEMLSFNLGLGMAYNNLGTLRGNSLRLEEALDFFRKSVVLMDTDVSRTPPLLNIGDLTTHLGQYEEAEKCLKEALRLEEKTQHGFIEAYAYYAILLTRTNRLKEARKYLKTAADIAEVSEKPLQKGAYLIARGIYELATKKWNEAICSFEEALKYARDNDLFEVLVRSELELARTHLRIYESKEDAEELQRAAYHLDDLAQISKEQGLQSLYAEVLLMRSDIYRHAKRNTEAKADIEKALSIASFVDDVRIKTQAEARLESLEGRHKEAAVDAAAVAKTMDRVAGFRPAGHMKIVPRPDLHVLLTLERESGLQELVHHFKSDIGMDSGLLSGFISAIASFSTEMTGGIGLLRSINHEGFTVMMEHTEKRIVTLIADKESFDIRFLLREFAKEFEIRYPVVTVEGIVDDTFKEAEELIIEIFSRVPETE